MMCSLTFPIPFNPAGLLRPDVLPTQARRRLLGQQVARQHFLPRALVVLRLELEHGLGLVLRQPHGLQVEVGQGKGQVL